jgi:hypothetical protein
MCGPYLHLRIAWKTIRKAASRLRSQYAELIVQRTACVGHPTEGRDPLTAMVTRHARIRPVHQLAELGVVALMSSPSGLRPVFACDVGAKSKQVESALHFFTSLGQRPRTKPTIKGAIRAGAWWASQKRKRRDIAVGRTWPRRGSVQCDTSTETTYHTQNSWCSARTYSETRTWAWCSHSPDS